MINNKIEIVTGRKGEGKSSLAYHFARLAHRGVAIFDPNGQFDAGVLVYSEDDFSALLEEPNAPTPIIFRPTGTVEAGFREFFQVIWTRKKIAVIVDEASLLGSAQRIDANLDKLIRLGRTKQLDIFLTAHRPQDLHGIVFSLADSYDFFQTTHPNDLARIENFTSAAARERVQQLGPHQFLHWDVQVNNFYVNTDPEGWREEIKRETELEPEFEEETSNGL